MLGTISVGGTILLTDLKAIRYLLSAGFSPLHLGPTIIISDLAVHDPANLYTQPGGGRALSRPTTRGGNGQPRALMTNGMTATARSKPCADTADLRVLVRRIA